ncbi:MAG: SUMF1/EgtB/PvdO family nonheme iron enzyme [Pirellulales bacterium]
MTHRTIFGRLIVLLLLPACMTDHVSATVMTEWIVVGDPGNADHTVKQADGTSGYGAVDYVYQMGKYEVTNSQYTEFLNAVASTDTNALYWTHMQSKAWGGILRSGSSGSYMYSVKPNMGNKPVNYVTWHDAARYTNWLHNDQPVGMQDATTTEDGAYTFIGFETNAPRNPDAQVFIPSEHEWHKAAFYQPGAVTSDGDEWWYYPTASDTLPLQAVADVNGDVRNPGPTVVNFFHGAGWNGQISGNVTTVGSAGNSTYYGAEDVGGNVFEWTTADPNKPDPFQVCKRRSKSAALITLTR